MDRNEVALDVLQEAADPVIQALDMSCFSRGDMVNLILQRLETFVDIPRRIAGVLHAEYRAMKDVVAPLATPGRKSC
jgi:hypothetical protein